jgi:hypothetical protein
MPFAEIILARLADVTSSNGTKRKVGWIEQLMRQGRIEADPNDPTRYRLKLTYNELNEFNELPKAS